MSDVLAGDVAYRSDSPPPAPEPTVTMPLPSDTRASDTAFSLGEMAEHAAENRISERDWLDNAAQELRQKRRDGDGLDGAPPIVEVKAARQDEPYTLREAQKEYSEGHRLYSASAALHNARQAIGSNRPITDDDIRRHDQNLHELQKMGVGSKPGEVDWNPMGMMTDGGREIPKLRDDQKVTTDLELTPRQAARLTGNWREVQERAHNELVETLRGEEAARQVTEVAQQLQQQPARPAPTQQQPQPQVDPVAAAQRQHLAAQQAALNLSAEQKVIAEQSAGWQRWASKIPEFQSWAAFNYTKQNDPARHAQVVKALQAGRAFNDAAANRWNELNEIRHSRAQRWAQTQGAQHARYQQAMAAQRQQQNQQQDSQFNSWLDREYPEYAKGRPREQLLATAKKMVQSAYGWNDAQLQTAWNNSPLRAVGSQQFITHAAVRELQKQMRDGVRAKRASVPQPHAPSAGGFRSNDADTEIRSLQQRLEGQSGRAALMTATQLQQARRRAGRV